MLMERLMSFRAKAVGGAAAAVFDRLLPFAEDRLRSTTLELEAPVAGHYHTTAYHPCHSLSTRLPLS